MRMASSSMEWATIESSFPNIASAFREWAAAGGFEISDWRFSPDPGGGPGYGITAINSALPDQQVRWDGEEWVVEPRGAALRSS